MQKKNLVYVVVGRLLLSFTFFSVHFLPVLKLIKKSTFRICRNLFRVIGVTDQEWLDSSISLHVVVGCSKWLPKSVFRSKRYRITYYCCHKGLICLNKANLLCLDLYAEKATGRYIPKIIEGFD